MLAIMRSRGDHEAITRETGKVTFAEAGKLEEIYSPRDLALTTLSVQRGIRTDPLRAISWTKGRENHPTRLPPRKSSVETNSFVALRSLSRIAHLRRFS